MSISENTRKNADVIKAGLSVDSNGTVTHKDGNGFISDLLPEGINLETVGKVLNARSGIISAAALAAGEVAAEARAKDPKIENVNFGFDFGHKRNSDYVEITTEASKLVGAPGKDKTEVKNYLSVAYTATGAKASKGELGKIRDHLKSYADEVNN